MEKTLTLYKKLGDTPLQTVEQFRADNPKYAQVKMAYAGRLDPMAEGELLVLVGEECKQREKYLGLDKEYEFEVLLGFESDTQDVLGLISNKEKIKDQNNLDTNIEKKITNIVKNLRGKVELPYPVFSSKTVNGKPLFLWALEKRLDEIKIPKRQSNIYHLELIERNQISISDLHQQVQGKIARVKKVTEESKQLGNDFRRTEVLKSWKNADHLEPSALSDQVQILKFRCVCSSGTYMRTLAQIIGEELGTGGLTWSIKRTKIGTYRHIPFIGGYWKSTY